MKHSLWVEISLAERYIKDFLKNGPLDEIGLTASEYFVLQFLVILDSKLSFYELNKLVPLDTKQLHLIVKKLLKKNYIERRFKKNTSEISVSPQCRKEIARISREHYSIIFEDIGEERIDLLVSFIKDFNDCCRKQLGRKDVKYKIQI